MGLLSVGEEEGKGNDLVKEAFEQLCAGRRSTSSATSRGATSTTARCDVVVTDGFTGNVCLKISESLAEMLRAMISEELTRDMRSAWARRSPCAPSRA